MELARVEEWPPTFTDDTTTLVLDLDAYNELGKPAKVDVTLAAVADEAPAAEPAPEPEAPAATEPTPEDAP